MKKISTLFINLFFVVLVSSLNAQTVVKFTSAALNLRESPNTDSKVLIVIPRGAEVIIKNPNLNACFFVSYNGSDGYVNSRYLTNEKPSTPPSRGSARTGADYYANSQGEEVQSPTRYDSAPVGATARCVDGTYSFSRSRRGTCSRHGGVAQWL